ncbi:50S ribosomal protein L17 [candidate division WOR-1 bacterium RIFCSPLOWO2_02_FULL_46_20]|uniref:Large ribosomal subunit protein bL17 n=2 Tax=Saganbacteria TaxID=1703751 RepID=A0A1F4R510_UNCSA|nr:MAG: 50S ribosomal protein L17 [candidate division WOR-1 bacterium RIFCSPHIGHO2_02_FULL_45_12]OGC03249.1 MAG: 50S ribosomal protein L17 [candidate division WOR-1 bacterium RIFCSPLOWO2_02_FULL_46_20]OGC08895.1 MAG: 50S ribosomal protein L17 [candidate division WOR-1 bacterium RIFCSPLOWO2_12_FULL_45_9]
MRHRKGNRKLGRPTDQRLAMLRDIVRGLFKAGKINVTLPRAKEARKLAEKLIAVSKKNNLQARRKMESFFGERKIVTEVFKTFPERFEGRAGGYTKIIKTGFRKGDAAQMAILELL